jgi:hypothetical protein
MSLCNSRFDANLTAGQWVRLDERSRGDPRLYRADLLDPEVPWRHDSSRLASVLMDIYLERTGPLGERVV